MSLLIRNGEIVTAETRYHADIYCEGEQITRIGKSLEAPEGATTVDASGKLVFPGFIDPHVHIYLPFMGTEAKDTYETASRAALVGGTTTLIEMCCPGTQDDHLTAFHQWRDRGMGRSACDFSFHMGVTRFDAQTEAHLREIVSLGISSFKVFLAYKGAFGLSDEALFKTLRLARELGAITTAHCENPELIDVLQKQLLNEGKTAPRWHYWSRPPRVEAEGVHHLLTFAEQLDTPVYIVHLSCREALEVAVGARLRGVKVRIETLIQYLLRDMTFCETEDFEGAKYVMSPPLRAVENQAVLWHALQQGLIDTLATDHAPFDFKGQKEMGLNDFTKIPNGIPSLEDRVSLLYSEGVCRGKLDLHRFVDVASTQAAKIFGLHPRKGTIAVGADADLVVFDPAAQWIIRAANHAMNVDYNAFEGMQVRGRVDWVSVRGKAMVAGGQFIGSTTHGQFIARPTGQF